MSKTWDTKKKILKLLSKGQMTLSEVSESLNLAPSTVSKHIEELKRIGAISMVDNPYIKKWKYYRANSQFNVQYVKSGGFMKNRITQIGMGALIILVALGALFVMYSSNQTGVFGPSGNLAFSLTDPPQVPVGTQSLIITYSSIKAHYVAEGGASGWITGSGSGTVNLLTLINSSQVIGNANVPVNSIINMVSFVVTSASITINGTTSPVIVPNNVITSNVNSNVKTSSNSSLLIDLSPTVVTLFTQNSTVFVMVPSVKAVLLGAHTLKLHVGERADLTNNERAELNAAESNISITHASLSSSGGITTFSVTVKNNGNQSVIIRHAMVLGGISVTVTPDINVTGNGTLEVNKQDRPEINSVIGGNLNSSSNVLGNFSMHGRGEAESHMTVEIPNLSGDVTNILNSNAGNLISTDGIFISTRGHGIMPNDDIMELVHVGINAKHFRVLNFLVTSNGTLALPFSEHDVEDTGYALSAGATATFTFSGHISLGQGRLNLSIDSGQAYNVVVRGEEGAHASTNVTAT